MNKLLMIGLIAIVSAGLIGGFMAVGGPAYARFEKQDFERAQNLEAIFVYLQCRTSNNVLPETLEDEGYCPNQSRPSTTKDTATGEPYDYQRLDDTSFSVCATFVTNAQKGKRGFPHWALDFDGQVGCRNGVISTPGNS